MSRVHWIEPIGCTSKSSREKKRRNYAEDQPFDGVHNAAIFDIVCINHDDGDYRNSGISGQI
jgi:hypothetical protein